MQEVKNIHILHLDLALKIMVMYIDSDLTEAKRESAVHCTGRHFILLSSLFIVRTPRLNVMT